MLPFTRDQFLAVFADYNLAVWPAQIVAYLLGAGIVLALLRPSRRSDGFVGAGLALMWIWTGLAYHATFFAAINQAAMGFAALFVVQGLLLAHAALIRADFSAAPHRGLAAWFGWALIGGSAAFLLGVPQDWPLLIGGLLVTPWLWRRPSAPTRPSYA